MFLAVTLQAKHLHYEKVYQNNFCNKMNGQVEYVLNDKTRVDCLTATYAIEVDFASKWAESIGQSLHYSIKTGKKAGVLLIIENVAKDRKYLRRLENVATDHNINVWTIEKDFTVVRY